MEERFEDLSIYTYKYIKDLAKSYKITNFKKKFFFNKELAYENNTIIIKKRNRIFNLNISDIKFYTAYPMGQYEYMYAIILVLKDSYIYFDYSSCVEYNYLMLNLYKNNVEFKNHWDVESYIKHSNLKKYCF